MADLITVRDLKVHLDVDAGTVKAVDGVSFRIPAGGTVALVGESGSGKSVIAQSILGILPRIARIESRRNRVSRWRREVGHFAASIPRGRAMRTFAAGASAIIFQEPMTALSPLHTIGNQIGEALALHSEVIKREQREAAEDMLRRVGFSRPAEARCAPSVRALRRPATARDDRHGAGVPPGDAHRRRADHRARRHHPGADPAAHPRAAEGVRYGGAVITHDLGVVANMADEVVVLHRGQVMESGTVDDIFRDARHPYLRR